LEMNLVDLHPSPDEIDAQLQGLGQHLCPYHTDMAQDHSNTPLTCLVDIETRQSMCHLFSFVEGHDLQVVSFVATLHQPEKGFRVVCGISHFRGQLLKVLIGKLDELAMLQLKRLELKQDFLFFGLRLGDVFRLL
jgi:hypothetical protein